jgi:uncharacterized protein (DUF58 family)
MVRRLAIRLRSRLALIFALSLLGLQSIAPTPPAMVGLVLIIGLHFLGYLWVRLAAAGVRATRERQEAPTFAGDTFTEQLCIRSRAWVPLLWGELRDPNALPGYPGSALIALRPRSETTVSLEGRALRRGIYALGPITLTMGDPFGLFEACLCLGAGARRVVYPRPQELPPLAQRHGVAPTEGPSGPDPLDRSPHAVTVRPYVPGDTPRRIHWRTTARRSLPGQDALYVKEFDPQSSGNLWLALDMQAEAQFGQEDESTEERAVVLAASLADQALRGGRGVGMIALGAAATLVTPRAGPEQRWRLLAELAGLRAEGDVPLREALRRLARVARRGDGVVVITASPDDAWLDGIRDLMWRGAQVEAILLTPGREAAASAPMAARASALSDLGVPHRIMEIVARPASRLAA